jgi:nucleoside-diphosphate-sugar epimerase
MRVLICGHRSFAARGLATLLRDAGHDVTCFSRGPVGESTSGERRTVTGPVDQIHANPHLHGKQFDAVVNYIMLKDEPIPPNLAYLDSLLQLIREQRIPHLVHISSISSYKGNVRVVTEDAPLEKEFEKKGSYGSIKAATDDYVIRHVPKETKLSLVRPGFILGEGLLNPIVGTAVRYPPSNELLVIGNAHSHIPMISRTQVNDAVRRIIEKPPTAPVEAFLLAAPNSPTRLEFLKACCKRLGIGVGVKKFPAPLWHVVGVGAEVAARLIGQGKMQPYAKIAARLPTQRFDASRTQQRLGMDLNVDWECELTKSLDAQDRNFDLPYLPHALPKTPATSVTFIGFGRIVKQKHLPALKRLGFDGRINAYDLRGGTDAASGQAVHAIDATTKLEPADLYVVASPGPAHTAALPPLRETTGPVLVEKPLAYTRDEVQQWADFAAARTAPVLVCHNYRFKENVQRMLALLAKHNPGKLRHVSVHFESPPVGSDSVAWLRNERKARTLLMDYAIHFLDLACMFGRGAWRADGVRYELNGAGETSLIEGRVLADNYSVAFLLRQGFGPRRARLLFNFQNYSTSLGFFPDTFVGYVANDNPWLYKQEKRDSMRATLRKVADKVLNRDADISHAAAFAAATADRPPDDPSDFANAIRIDRVKPFYDLLFDLGDVVYPHSNASTS